MPITESLTSKWIEGIGSLKYVLQEDDFMGKIDAELTFQCWFTRNTKNFVRYRWSTSSDYFCATWKLNKEFYQNFCGPWQWWWEKQACLSLSAGQNFCHGTDKGILMSHADYCQGVTDIGFQARSHVKTLNFLGLLEHLTTLTIICQR